ncbi:hypothetical protein ES705_41951 [subsurface metagenome]
MASNVLRVKCSFCHNLIDLSNQNPHYRFNRLKQLKQLAKIEGFYPLNIKLKSPAFTPLLDDGWCIVKTELNYKNPFFINNVKNLVKKLTTNF